LFCFQILKIICLRYFWIQLCQVTLGSLQKVAISDSQESMVLRLTTLNDYERKINEITNKYYSEGRTIQPFITVEGMDDRIIKAFYVSFDRKLVKPKTFIETLDACFKVFQVLALEYPQACKHAWLFLQTYFYNIITPFDFKSFPVFSFIHFLKPS